jgi:hypothetical protein
MPKRPPASFLPTKWRKLIFANGAADRRLALPLWIARLG